MGSNSGGPSGVAAAPGRDAPGDAAPAASGLGRRVLAGEQRAIARLVTLLEDGDPAAVDAMRELAGAPRAHLIGITGPPGSGKSTLADKLIAAYRAAGERVGVLAVDPSSPFSGGAILGDRLRMQRHAEDEGVFIRSLASRGRLGGLSRATAAAARVLGAAGYGVVLVETVGVGQSEVEVVSVADTVLLVSVPGLGDDIQAIKAGVMEIGDVFVVNKADREGADRAVREIRAMLETAAALAAGRAPAAGPDTLASHHRFDGPALQGEGGHPAMPPVLKTVAETGEGIGELMEALGDRRRAMESSGLLEMRRRRAARAEIRSLVAARVAEALEAGEGRALEEELAAAVAAGERDAYEAAETLFSAIARGGIR